MEIKLVNGFWQAIAALVQGFRGKLIAFNANRTPGETCNESTYWKFICHSTTNSMTYNIEVECRGTV